MRCALSSVLILAMAAVAPAAPLPKGPELNDQYLLDDADMIAVVNVPLIRSSPMYKDHYEKMLGDLLKQEPVAGILKEAGLDPRKDVERVLMMLGHSCFTENGGESAPVFLFQGRFDPTKLLAAAAKLAKDYPTAVKVEARGDAKIIQLGGGFFTFHAAVLDKGNVILASNKALVEGALDKAAGKKKTDLKNKAFVELFRKTKFDHAVEAVATGNMVTHDSKSIDPSGKKERKLHTLAETGVESFRVVVDVKDQAKVSVALTAKDAATALDLEKKIGEEIKVGAGFVAREAPKFGAALAAAKVGSKDKTVTIDGQGGADAVREMILGTFGVGVAEPSLPPPPPPAAKP